MWTPITIRTMALLILLLIAATFFREYPQALQAMAVQARLDLSAFLILLRIPS
jgi:hypothetical protein